jgi:hypothetical protein
MAPCCPHAGNNVFGQLGLGNWEKVNTMMTIPKLQSKDVMALQAGDFSSAAICDSGNVYLWGRNDCNQLGLGDDMSRCSPTLLKGFKVCLLLSRSCAVLMARASVDRQVHFNLVTCSARESSDMCR